MRDNFLTNLSSSMLASQSRKYVEPIWSSKMCVYLKISTEKWFFSEAVAKHAWMWQIIHFLVVDVKILPNDFKLE